MVYVLTIGMSTLKNILIIYTLEVYPVMISHFALNCFISLTLISPIFEYLMNFGVSFFIGSGLLIGASFLSVTKLRETFGKPMKLFVEEYENEIL